MGERHLEMDSDPEDPEKLLDTWLEQLDHLTTGLEKSAMRPSPTDCSSPTMDSYRFSMANLEESQDVDLDAILGELCALESQYDEAIQSSAKSDVSKANSDDSSSGKGSSGSSSSSGQGSNAGGGGSSGRTHSPDNDSAFSDSVSLLSSESSASSGRTELQGERTKAEKIRLALQKMKDASVKKLFIKVFSHDGSGKSLLVDEGMSCGYVMQILAEKNHVELDQQWALVEHLTDLQMERVFEEHESLVDQLMVWTRDSKNKLLFVRRPDERTFLFTGAHLFVGGAQDPSSPPVSFAESERMLEEFFSGCCVPTVEGPLYVKTDSRKGWKRYQCILRASGLYYWPKAKSSSKDLLCLATFDMYQVYYGVGWKKKYKSPTEWCFGIKHPSLQQAKSAKYIKFLCADDPTTMHKWVTAIRIIKYGRQLLVNQRCRAAGLIGMAGSVSSIGTPSSPTGGGSGGGGGGLLPPSVDGPAGVVGSHRVVLTSLDRVVDSQGLLMSDGSTADETGSTLLGSNNSSSSSGCDAGFEAEEFPSGTIKRKPPRLPLTATTRQLKEMAEMSVSAESLLLPPPPPPHLLLQDVVNQQTPDEEEERTVDSLPPPPPPLESIAGGFLDDLERVMRRKWQVAEKLGGVSSSSGGGSGGGACRGLGGGGGHHPVVLGFRDPPVTRDVGSWVEEHYGGPSGGGSLGNGKMGVGGGRKPPPPPPRALSTHLTTVPPQYVHLQGVVVPPVGPPPPSHHQYNHRNIHRHQGNRHLPLSSSSS